ncbi:MAG: hypothetical protein ABSE25_11075 [Syntrophorhabdales bacterium]|jgi:hypothetical protein
MMAGLQVIDRLLVFSPDEAGESVLTIPALGALRRSYPFSRIILMATPAVFDSVRRLPFIDAAAHRGARDEAAYIGMIAGLSCKGAVIFTSPGRSPYPDAYRCYLAGIPVRVGESCEFGGGVLSHWVRTAAGARPQDRYLSLVAQLPGSSISREMGP